VTERVETVPAALDGQRVDRVVAMVTGLSRTEASALVSAGAVAVDGRVVSRGADRLQEGQVLVLDAPEPAEEPRPQPDAGIEVPIVYADDDVVIVDKPADLVVHPGAGHDDGTLVNGLLALFPEIAEVGQPDRPGIVHRLDRGTSGLLAVARSERAYESLVAQLQARTRYEVEHRFAEPTPTSEVVCRLETGRTHQIRVHLSAIGHSVVGDDRYHGVRQSLPCPRPFLHAEHLGFVHPGTGEDVAFDSALPADLVAVLAQVR
jgi:23S rRNA pseudouridine1911/1915/1917 synthase